MYSLASGSILHLVQITDAHILATENGQLLGMKTRDSLQKVLNKIRQERHQIDAFLVTGDLSQDDSLESYQYIKEKLSAFASPSFWFKGNHDDEKNMQKAAQGAEHLEQVIRTDYWQIVLLNSQVEGSVFGYLAEDQLDLLQKTLSERPDLHTLISFHHHPVAMGSRWIDQIGLKNADQFFALVGQHKNVRAVLFGHVHQQSDEIKDGIRLLSSPSTCIQFTRHSDDFAVDTLEPGYRWLDLHSNGQIDTGVSRVEGMAQFIDYSSKGY